VVVAAATSTAALGLLVVLHPFAAATPVVAGTADSTTADALHARIDALRASLHGIETSLDAAAGSPPAPAAGTQHGQLDARIAAAIDRRDLVVRSATAIRDALQTGAPISSLAGIRDSAVIAQLTAQEAALDAQIVEQGARLRPAHPTMRALAAQRSSLGGQVKAEAASVADALEAEARADDAQVKLLQSQVAASPAPAISPATDTASLQAEAASERTQIDSLTDDYFNLRPSATSPATRVAGFLTPLNLFVAGIAGIAALVFQVALAVGRRPRPDDLAGWRADDDPEAAPEPGEAEPVGLRRAS
jgi:hypothetical protein